MNVRDAFFEEVYLRVCSGEDFFIVSSDLGAPSLDQFRAFFPNRFVNVGIAEQNAISVASGLALAGKKVIYYGLNPFPVTRAFDQIRNLMSSRQIPITIATLHAGTCNSEAGFSHLPIENISLLRTLFGINIINPSDVTISKKLVEEIIADPFPRYVQFDKEIVDDTERQDEYSFKQGFSVINKRKTDIVIITYGIFAFEIIKRSFDIEAKIIDCFSIPIDEKEFITEIKMAKKIYTVEDAIAQGGIGSMILEILSDNGISIPVERMAIRGSGGYLKRHTNRKMIWKSEKMTMDDIMTKIRRDRYCYGE